MVRLSVLVLLFACVFGVLGLANPNECTTNSDCSSGNGKCVTVDTNEAYCSCYSGYSGEKCSVPPPTGFVASKVDSSSSAFAPLLDFTLGSSVTLVVVVPSELSENDPSRTSSDSYATQTTIKFSGSNDCDYPTATQWATSTSQLEVNGTTRWYDQYVAVFEYTQLVACGLTQKATSSRADTIEYSTKLVVRRDYVQQDANGSGFTLPASNSISKDLNFFFPTKVHAQTTINAIDNSVATFTGVTQFGYDIATNLWSFTLGAAVSANYELKLSATPVLSESVRNITLGSLSNCDSYDNDAICKQTYTITVEGCNPIQFLGQLNFDIVCRKSFTKCVDAATTTASPTIKITTASSCPVGGNLTFTGITMNSFSDANFNKSMTSFGTSHTLYFGVDFQSLARVIGVSIQTICVRPYDVTDTTFAACGSRNTDVTFSATTVTPTDELQFGFSLAGRQFKEEFGVTRLVSTRFTVQADLNVDTVDLGSTKRSIVFHTAQSKTDVSIFDDSAPQDIAANKSSASSLIAGAALVLAIATLF